MARLYDTISQLPGYRISDSHFRVGSKIHVSDFYFARRFFQNSYYATRLAYLLAQDVWMHKTVSDQDVSEGGITLIGYGLYSELLLSLTEKYLAKKVRKINHDLVKDYDDPELIKGLTSIYKYVAIIVPIASTFLTAQKIEESLHANGRFHESHFLNTHFNVLHIYDEREDFKSVSVLEKSFGWIEKHPRSVDIRPMLGGARGEMRSERFILGLPSSWKPIESCDLCFPFATQTSGELRQKTGEKPIFVTETQAITPAAVFDFPREQSKLRGNCPRYVLTNSLISHGHIIRSNGHFRYYVNVEDFFRQNKSAVLKWLAEDVEPGLFTGTRKRTLIVAPANYSNAGFVDAVNEIVFANTATVIHYDAREEAIQNFQRFYGEEFGSHDVRVFFVDDTITTGATFLKMNYFVKHTRPEGSDKDRRGLDGAIVLLDRSDHFVHENIGRKLDSASSSFYFAGLHIPLMNTVRGKCPICAEYERYGNLAGSSCLDQVKTYFLDRRSKLGRTAGDFPSPTVQSGDYTNSILAGGRTTSIEKVGAMFRIIEWFAVKENRLGPEVDFTTWFRSLAEIKLPFDDGFEKATQIGSLSRSEAAVLKVLSYSQLSRYAPLRESAFQWSIQKLTETMNRSLVDIETGAIAIATLRDLKFLMRRVALLGSNYLISHGFLIFLRALLTRSVADKLDRELFDFSSTVLSKEKDFQQQLFGRNLTAEELDKIGHEDLLSEFVRFYVAQVKELCSLNDARCIYLEQTLDAFGSTPGSDRFDQMRRILRLENGFLLESFWTYLKGFVMVAEKPALLSRELDAVMSDASTQDHYKVQSLQNFLTLGGGQGLEAVDFKEYLGLLLYLEREDNTDQSLEEKTDEIVTRLRKLAGCSGGRGGAFLIVRYRDPKNDVAFGHDEHFVAYNKGSAGLIETSEFFSESNGFLAEFFKGNGLAFEPEASKVSTVTIVELHRDAAGWVETYSNERKPVAIDPNFIRSANRILIIRLARKQSGDDKEDPIIDIPQGLIAFYFNGPAVERSKPLAIIDPRKTRYLLLLRRHLGRFIRRHHANAEFRDWIEADHRRRISALTGHGSQTLINLAMHAKERDRYRRIVSTLLMVQRFVLDRDVEQQIYRGGESQDGEFGVASMFKRIYAPEQTKPINVEFAKGIARMAEEIFDSKYIENTVQDVAIQLNCPDDFSFSYSPRILEMICFELLVNAKKNRWIFTPDDEPLELEGTIITKNRVTIDFAITQAGARITVASTGPSVERVSRELFNDLNQGINPKSYEPAAGLRQIWTVLDLFGHGKVSYEPIEWTNGLAEFKAIMNLTTWTTL